MKTNYLIIICFIFLRCISYAQDNKHPIIDSSDIAKNHKINFCFTWFETGIGIPLKEKKLKDLPYGMNHYLYTPKNTMIAGFFGLGLYYKNHWGITVIYSYQDYSVPDAAYTNYISNLFPNYYLPYGVQGHTYSISNIDYRLSYRFHKKRFTFEPQFQLGINDYNDFDTQFVLKEKGSNNFIEYSIKKENQKKHILSYQAALVTRYRFTKPQWKWNIEPGIRVAFMLTPTDHNYTISYNSYNSPATVNKVNIKQLNPNINITVVMGVFRK